MKRFCLLDLNYTLVSNQSETKNIRPFSARLEQEEYRKELIDAIKDDYVIIITARPDYQMTESLENIKGKTGWLPDEQYFNDIDAEPPAFKESALKRFVFPKHGEDGNLYYAVESNPKTREMYAKYGIQAMPYQDFILRYQDAKEIHEALNDVQNVYPGVEQLTKTIASRNDKKQEIIDFIRNNKPTSSDLIFFLSNIDYEISKQIHSTADD